MMNLQEAKLTPLESTRTTRSGSMLRFERVVGSIGELLEHSMVERSMSFDTEEVLEESHGDGPTSTSA